MSSVAASVVAGFVGEVVEEGWQVEDAERIRGNKDEASRQHRRSYRRQTTLRGSAQKNRKNDGYQQQSMRVLARCGQANAGGWYNRKAQERIPCLRCVNDSRYASCHESGAYDVDVQIAPGHHEVVVGYQ